MRASKKSNTTKTLLILLLVVLVLTVGLALAAVVMNRDKSEETGPVQTDSAPAGTTASSSASATEPEETQWIDTVVQFPYACAEGRLEIDSLFQFTGFNPDCEGQEGTDIAAIQLKNTFGAHLTQAKLTLTMDNGTVLTFTVTDLPAGKSAMAFSLENASIEMESTCVEVSCEASFEEESPLMADKLSIQVEGTEITVTNISGEDLSQLTVCCHCLLDEDYFGGLTYEYLIETLPAGESATVDAVDCYLGDAEVVRIGS